MKRLMMLMAGTLLLAALARPGYGADDGQIVIEDLSIPQLRAEIEKIQNEIYRVFNAQNTNDDFDIVCHAYVPTGSNISQEACEPQFVIDRRGENAKDYREGTDDLLSQQGLIAELQPEFQELTDRMNAVAKDSQYFRELNQIVGMLRERLQELTD